MSAENGMQQCHNNATQCHTTRTALPRGDPFAVKLSTQPRFQTHERTPAEDETQRRGQNICRHDTFYCLRRSKTSSLYKTRKAQTAADTKTRFPKTTWAPYSLETKMPPKNTSDRPRSLTWAFTINSVGNEVEPAVHPLWGAGGTPDCVQYAKWQLEKGETDGRLHLQGVIRFRSQVRMLWVKSVLGAHHAHVETVRSWEHAKAYCGKAETRVAGPWEVGEDGPGRGTRSDLARLSAAVTATTTMADLAEKHPEEVVKFGRGLQHLILLKNPPRRREKLEVYVFYGTSGVGKTWLVHDLCKSLYTVFCLKNPWFDGYEGEDAILLDDYGPKLMDINLLKRVLDVYPMVVPIKGGKVALNCTKIFITTNYKMEEWYPTAGPSDFHALMRRVRFYDFGDGGKERFLKTWNERRGLEEQQPQPLQRLDAAYANCQRREREAEEGDEEGEPDPQVRRLSVEGEDGTPDVSYRLGPVTPSAEEAATAFFGFPEDDEFLLEM